jgi:hypothetical protein
MKKPINRIISSVLALVTLWAGYSSAQATRGGGYEGFTAAQQPNQQALFYKRLAPDESSGWSIETSGALEKVTAVPDGWICEAGGYTAFTHFARLRYKVPEQAGMVLTTFYMKMVVVLPADFYAQQMVGFRLMTTDNYTTTLNGAPVGANDVNETRASVYINSDHSLRVKVEHETISSKILYISQSPLPVGEHTLELFGSLNVVAPWYLRIDGVMVASGMEMLSNSDTTPNERVATRLATGILGAADQDANSMNVQIKSFEIANYDRAGVIRPTSTPSQVPTQTTAIPTFPGPTNTPTAVTPTDTSAITHDDTDGAFVYSPSAWETISTQDAYKGSFQETTRNGSFVTFSFTGQSFSILYKAGVTFSKFIVYVDDELVGTLDQYASEPTYRERWDYPGQLAYGDHTLMLVFKVTSSAIYRGSLDAVIVR